MTIGLRLKAGMNAPKLHGKTQALTLERVLLQIVKLSLSFLKAEFDKISGEYQKALNEAK